MNPIFSLSGTPYYQINEEQKNVIIDIFNSNSGIFEIPKEIWQNELNELPSPIRSKDCCNVYTSGCIDNSQTNPESNIFDVIRNESRPLPNEPDYNVYRHRFVTSGGEIFISAQIHPDHHWATSGTLNRIYNFKIS